MKGKQEATVSETLKNNAVNAACVLFAIAIYLWYCLGVANGRIDHLNARLLEQKKQADSDVSTLQSRLDDAQHDGKSLKEKLDSAALPEVRVTVSFGGGGVFSKDSGYIAHITNQEGASASFTAKVERPSSDRSKTYNEFVIDSGQTADIGESQGWAFISGDTITISEVGHKPLMWTVR